MGTAHCDHTRSARPLVADRTPCQQPSLWIFHHRPPSKHQEKWHLFGSSQAVTKTPCRSLTACSKAHELWSAAQCAALEEPVRGAESPPAAPLPSLHSSGSCSLTQADHSAIESYHHSGWERPPWSPTQLQPTLPCPPTSPPSATSPQLWAPPWTVTPLLPGQPCHCPTTPSVP